MARSKQTARESTGGAPPRKHSPAAKKPSPSKKVGKKHAKKRDSSTLDIYIKRILKQVHPDAMLKSEAMVEMNLIVKNTLAKIAEVANKLGEGKHQKTVTSRTIQSAVMIVLPGELAKHAVSHGTKAVIKFNSDEGAKGKHTERAGLTLSVPRVGTMLRSHSIRDRVSIGAKIYLAAVLDYLIAEILELAGNAARDNKKIKINSRFILLAIENDEELHHLFKHFILPGGVLPLIHSVLLPRKGKKSKKAEEEL